MRVITFKLDDETLERLDTLASELGLSRSEVIRVAIATYLNKKTSKKAEFRRVLLV